MKETPTADSLTAISAMFAFISISQIQSYVSITAGMVAIISGLCAARYYLIKTKK